MNIKHISDIVVVWRSILYIELVDVASLMYIHCTLQYYEFEIALFRQNVNVQNHHTFALTLNYYSENIHANFMELFLWNFFLISFFLFLFEIQHFCRLVAYTAVCIFEEKKKKSIITSVESRIEWKSNDLSLTLMFYAEIMFPMWSFIAN